VGAVVAVVSAVACAGEARVIAATIAGDGDEAEEATNSANVFHGQAPGLEGGTAVRFAFGLP
jgi:hypothetical protein